MPTGKKTLRLDAALHKELKLIATDKTIALEALVAGVLRSYVASQKKKPKNGVARPNGA